VQLRAYIEKIRPIDKQLSYQIDKLLRATSVAQSQAAADAAAGAADGDEAAAAGAAAAGGDDALRYRPNPQALIAKAPLLGDAEGEQQLCFPAHALAELVLCMLHCVCCMYSLFVFGVAVSLIVLA
jgi:hypothetical protein